MTLIRRVYDAGQKVQWLGVREDEKEVMLCSGNGTSGSTGHRAYLVIGYEQ